MHGTDHVSVDGSGTVAYSGHGGAFNTGNAQYATAYDNTADSFDETLQVDMWRISPQLNAVNWDSPLQELIRSAIDFANYLGDTGQELLDELGLFYSDFSGNFEYRQSLVQDEIDTYKSYQYGRIDGFFNAINPFDHFLSVPDLGAVEGHEFAYTVGQVEGTVTAIAAQFVIGAVSGGATAPLVVSSVSKLNLLAKAAQVYTAVDTAGAVATGIAVGVEPYQKWDNLSGWQVAGNALTVGSGFAAGAGHVVGRLGTAGRKLDGAAEAPLLPILDDIPGGCFVAGTKVTVEAMPASAELQSLITAVAQHHTSASRAIDAIPTEDGGFDWTKHSKSVAIESVPLGARIGTINPQSWDYDDSLPECDQNSWSQIELTAVREDGAVIDIQLLRPDQWVLDNSLFVGSEIPLYIEELDLHGKATVQSLSACPNLAMGHGECVIGRYATRKVTETVKLKLIDGTELEGTPVHPIWSVDRQDFTPMSELQTGERLQTANGPVAIATIQTRNTPVPVYNIEVRGHHVYEITNCSILVHNAGCVGVRGVDSSNGLYFNNSFDEVLDLGQQAVRYRERLGTLASKLGLDEATRRIPHANVAVVEYVDEFGRLQTITRVSGRAGHSEARAISVIKQRLGENFSKNSITRLYSDLSPCKARGCTLLIENNTSPNLIIGWLTDLAKKRKGAEWPF